VTEISAESREEHRRQLLEHFPVFAELPAARLDALIAQAQWHHAPAGSVRVTKPSPSGREILLYRVEPGQGCLLSGGCLLGHSDYSATGIAEEDVVYLSIPPLLFHELMLQFEPFRRFVFGMYGERLAAMMELVEEVAFRKLDSRLAQLLVHRGPVVQTTHQKLADELGSVREIVSRLLRSFEDRGWVRLEREQVSVLDPKALAELAANRA
jgi:CRP/FNR family transcriptional regulator